MSLFSYHQLAFAFLVAIKIHEKMKGALAQDDEAEVFRQKLQMLDQGLMSAAGS